MISELKVLDTVEFKCNVANKFVCDISDEHLTSIVTDRGVLICSLDAVKENKTQAICYNKKIIKTSQFILQNNLEIELPIMMPHLSPKSTREVMINLNLAIPLSPNTVCKPVTAKWSRKGCIGEQCLITVQNDFGSLDLYCKIASCTGLTEYKWLENITTLHIKKFKSQWNDMDNKNITEILEEYKYRINLHLLSAFAWSHIIEDCLKKYCFIITAHKSGKLFFWKINYCNIEDHKDIICEFEVEFETNLNDIKCLEWKESVNSGLLFLGTTKGALYILPITNIRGSVEFSDLIILKPGSDVVSAIDKIFTTQHESHHYVLVVQMEMLIIYLFDNCGEILDSVNFSIGCIHISDIIDLGENKFLVASISGDLKEIQVSCDNSNKLNIDWKYIYVNLNWSIYRCNGMFASKNRVIISFILDCSKPIRIKDEKDTVHLTNTVNDYCDPLQVLLANTSHSLQDYYDYIEAFRVTGLFAKKLICDKFPPNIDYDSMNLLQLKTHLYLSIISEYIHDQVELTPKFTLRPSKDVECLIQIKLVVYYAQMLIKERDQECLDNFKITSLKLIISYLTEVVMNDSVVKLNLGDNVLDEIFDIISRTEDENLTDMPVCSICQESLFGKGCMSSHFMNKCMISLTEIINPKYHCRQCNKYVCEEVMKDFEELLCPFCDLQLEILFDQYPDLNTNLLDTCKEDCIQESPISINSICNSL